MTSMHLSSLSEHETRSGTLFRIHLHLSVSEIARIQRRAIHIPSTVFLSASIANRQPPQDFQQRSNELLTDSTMHSDHLDPPRGRKRESARSKLQHMIFPFYVELDGAVRVQLIPLVSICLLSHHHSLTLIVPIDASSIKNNRHPSFQARRHITVPNIPMNEPRLDAPASCF